MNKNEYYPRESLRRRLSSLGIPRRQHDTDALWGMLPVRLSGAPFDEMGADALAEVLLYLIEKEIIRVPCRREALPDLDWGAHVCQFYHGQDDLLELLVPYFRRGLESDEYCVWVVAPPLTVQAARAAMARTLAGFERFERQMEFVDHDGWYLEASGALKSTHAIRAGWLRKMEHALDLGFHGLRCSGDTRWIAQAGWKGFMHYESEVNAAIGGLQMKAVCTYPLWRWGADALNDVLASHQGLLVKCEQWWHRIATADVAEARAVLLALQGGRP